MSSRVAEAVKAEKDKRRAANAEFEQVLKPVFERELAFERVKESAKSYFENLPFDEIHVGNETCKVHTFGLACEILESGTDDRTGLVITIWSPRPSEKVHGARVVLANLAAAAAHTAVSPVVAEDYPTDKVLGSLDARKRQELRKKLLSATIPIGKDVTISNFIELSTAQKTEILLPKVSLEGKDAEQTRVDVLVQLATLLATLGYAFVDDVALGSHKTGVARCLVGICYDDALVELDGILMANEQRLDTEAAFKRWHVNRAMRELGAQPKERAAGKGPSMQNQFRDRAKKNQRARNVQERSDKKEQRAADAAAREERMEQAAQRRALVDRKKAQRQEERQQAIEDETQPFEDELEAFGPLAGGH